MNTWIKKPLIFVVAGALYLVGQYFRGMWFVHTNIVRFCRSYVENGKTYCNSPYINNLGWPLIIAGEYFAAIGLILLLANERGFRRWLWTSIVYIPVAFGLILWIYPLHTPLGGVAPYAQGVRLFGNIYILITLGIVLRARFKKPKQI